MIKPVGLSYWYYPGSKIYVTIYRLFGRMVVTFVGYISRIIPIAVVFFIAGRESTVHINKRHKHALFYCISIMI